MSDAQTWSVIGLLVATFLGLFTEMRSQVHAHCLPDWRRDEAKECCK